MHAATGLVSGYVERDATSRAAPRMHTDHIMCRPSGSPCCSSPFAPRSAHFSRPATFRFYAIRQDSTRTGAASISFTDVQVVDTVVTETRGSSSDQVADRQQPAKSKILKINIDLALYRARQTRRNAFRTTDTSLREELNAQVEAAFRRCMSLDPTDGRAYVSLGKLLVDQQRLQEAEQVYEQGSMAAGGQNAHIWTAWANLAAKKGDISKARKLFDAATVANDKHAAAWHGWGLLEKRQGNYLRARDLWSKGVQLTRQSPNPYLYQSLAVMAAELGRVEEARKWFNAGTKTQMGSASNAMWQAWALMESRQGDSAMVRNLYRKGLEANPKSRYIYLAWAWWEKSQGKTENARKLLRRGHELNRRDPALLQAHAMLEEASGNIGLARRLFKQGSQADPSHLYIWQAWGVLEYRQGDLETARQLFRQGIMANPRSKDVALVFQAWAVLERSASNYSAARELFKCAIKADPKSTPSWLAWAAMEEDLGAYERATELRNYNMQEQTQLVLPQRLLSDPDQMGSGSLVDTLRTWFSSFEAASSAPSKRQPPPLKKLGNVNGMQLTQEMKQNSRKTNATVGKSNTK